MKNKILLPLPWASEITVLERVISRIKNSKRITSIAIATTINEKDEAIVEIAEKLDIGYHRGSENNVLERYFETAKLFKYDIIVRITSDCPCIDWNILDILIDKILSDDKIDYVRVAPNKNYPHGIDVEIFTFSALEKAYKNANESFHKEHVTSFFYQSGQFVISEVILPTNYVEPGIRITLDTIEDYTLLCFIYDYLFDKARDFTVLDIIALFQEKPWLKLINAKVMQKKVNFENFNDELDEALKLLTLQGLNNVVKFIQTK